MLLAKVAFRRKAANDGPMALRTNGPQGKIYFTGIWDCYNFKTLKESRYAISSV
jgi:hypothetical protein